MFSAEVNCSIKVLFQFRGSVSGTNSATILEVNLVLENAARIFNSVVTVSLLYGLTLSL